jgi:hypothetical protein
MNTFLRYPIIFGSVNMIVSYDCFFKENIKMEDESSSNSGLRMTFDFSSKMLLTKDC